MITEEAVKEHQRRNEVIQGNIKREAIMRGTPLVKEYIEYLGMELVELTEYETFVIAATLSMYASKERAKSINLCFTEEDRHTSIFKRYSEATSKNSVCLRSALKIIEEVTSGATPLDSEAGLDAATLMFVTSHNLK